MYLATVGAGVTSYADTTVQPGLVTFVREEVRFEVHPAPLLTVLLVLKRLFFLVIENVCPSLKDGRPRVPVRQANSRL